MCFVAAVNISGLSIKSKLYCLGIIQIITCSLYSTGKRHPMLTLKSSVSGEDSFEQGDWGESSEDHVERVVDLSTGNQRMGDGGAEMPTALQ